MKQDPTENMYLHGSLPLLFLKTATPIILVMTANGIHALVDAWFLGEFVGADALTAVTLMFPFFMVIVAVSTLVSNGYASVVARLLGADRRAEAQNAYLEATVLSLLIALALAGLFLAFGDGLIGWLAHGSAPLAEMGSNYITPMVFGSALMLVTGVNTDSLRCEGRLSFMTLVTLSATLLNIPFNYLLIVEMEMGVPGSAYGTLLAHACALLLILQYRMRGRTVIGLSAASGYPIWKHGKSFLSLGLPFSLTYIGVSLVAMLVLNGLQVWSPDNYETSAAAYGIITRLMTFTYMPILGLSLAFQAILGNNYGAGDMARADRSFYLAMLIALAYSLGVEAIYQTLAAPLADLFVDDAAIVAETARILPMMTMLMLLFGPQIMATTYFQAVGDAKRALLLSVVRMYLLALPLIFLLPYFLGEPGIWLANPATEAIMALITASVLIQYRRGRRAAALAGT